MCPPSQLLAVATSLGRRERAGGVVTSRGGILMGDGHAGFLSTAPSVGWPHRGPRHLPFRHAPRAAAEFLPRAASSPVGHVLAAFRRLDPRAPQLPDPAV